MNIGLVFPQTEIGNDPQVIKDYAQAAEDLGYTHILAYDHVLGANPNRPDRLTGPYTHETPFHEVFVLFGFIAAATHRIGLTTGILILPQRQTVLVARQAAAVDVLSGGRLRLGVGLGWNHVEYQSLNEDFHNRGARIEEQVQVLRLLWTQPLVTFHGRWHHIPDAGLKPLPVQRPIPIWFGGHHEKVLSRAARLGDGWMPNYRDPAQAQASIDSLRRQVQAAGRDWSTFGIEARIPYGDGNPAAWRALRDAWQAAGATHLSFNTMGAGLPSPDRHLAAIRRIAGELEISS